MSEPAWELPDATPLVFAADTTPVAEWKGPPDTTPTVGTIGGWDVDGGMLIYPEAGVDEPPTWASRADALKGLSASISLIPVVGTVKDLVEGISGEDIVTGEKLSTAQRVIDFVAVAADMVSFGEAGAEIRAAEAGIEAGIKTEVKMSARELVLKGVLEGASKYNDVNDLNTLFPTF